MNQKDFTRNKIVLIVFLVGFTLMIIISAIIVGFKIVQSQAIVNAINKVEGAVLLLEKTDDGYQEVNYGQPEFNGLTIKENDH